MLLKKLLKTTEDNLKLLNTIKESKTKTTKNYYINLS